MKNPSSAPRRNSKRRIVAAAMAAFGIGLIAGFAPAAASAGVVTGTVGGYSSGGHSYENSATIQTVTSSHLADAFTNTAPNGWTAPAGYLGSRGRLFRDISGRPMYCEGANTYSTTSLTSGSYMSGISCITYSPISAWFSYGVSLAFNGSGYNSVYTFQTVDQNN